MQINIVYVAFFIGFVMELPLFVSLLQSHEDHSDDELRDCDSVEGDHMTRVGSRLNSSMNSNGGDISGHEHNNELQMRFVQVPPHPPLNNNPLINDFPTLPTATIISFQQITH